jgi:hypothetical protein
MAIQRLLRFQRRAMLCTNYWPNREFNQHEILQRCPLCHWPRLIRLTTTSYSYRNCWATTKNGGRSFTSSTYDEISSAAFAPMTEYFPVSWNPLWTKLEERGQNPRTYDDPRICNPDAETAAVQCYSETQGYIRTRLVLSGRVWYCLDWQATGTEGFPSNPRRRIQFLLNGRCATLLATHQ